MPEAAEAGPSLDLAPRPSTMSMSRRRSSGTRLSRSRPIRPRATSSVSQRSDTSNISSGLQQLSWTSGDCFDYVDHDARISAFLHCPICLGPFLDPYASTRCSHTFCKQCITTALSDDDTEDNDPLLSAARKRCPTCRTAVELSDFEPTALLIKNMVDTLQVRCPNASKGCTYICERHLLYNHVSNSCAYEYVDQNLVEGKRCGCSAKVMRKDWASHGLTCPKRKITCLTCDEVLPADEMVQHSQVCSPEPVHCEFCGFETIKSRLETHVAEECGEAVVGCEHARFGCDWRGERRKLRRRQDDAGKSTHRIHLPDKCRFEPIKAFFSVFSRHMDEIKEENASLKSRIEEMESRQLGQIRRLDDCVHSLGSWYRSAGELRSVGLEHGGRGSQVGVDGEWDEFPLDAQNWERSLSQQSFAARQGRAHSADAISSADLAIWARRGNSSYSPLDLPRPSSSSHPAAALEEPLSSSSRYLAPPTARSMLSTSALTGHTAQTPSPSRERPSYLNDLRRTAPTLEHANSGNSVLSRPPYAFTSLAHPVDVDRDVDRSNLDAAIASLTSSIAGLSTGLSTLDKRTEEGHIAAVKAGFDAGRVQEEVASLRHGLHAVRMQIHQILMQQQRYAIFSPSMGIGAMGHTTTANGTEAGPSNATAAAGSSMRELGGVGVPMLSPPLLRRWAGLEHTKL